MAIKTDKELETINLDTSTFYTDELIKTASKLVPYDIHNNGYSIYNKTYTEVSELEPSENFTMNILHISDTHQNTFLFNDIVSSIELFEDKGLYQYVPNVVAVTGDIMSSGFSYIELKEFSAFLDFCNSKNISVLFVPGNHDRPFDLNHFTEVCDLVSISKDKQNLLLDLVHEISEKCHVLINDSVVIDSVMFHGFSWQPEFFNWAFNADPEKRKEEVKKIPEDTDILLLHSPPYKVLDYINSGKHVGDEVITEFLANTSGISTVLFGHIHDQGQKQVITSLYGSPLRLYRNGSMIDWMYAPYVNFGKALKEKDVPALVEIWNGLLVKK